MTVSSSFKCVAYRWPNSYTLRCLLSRSRYNVMRTKTHRTELQLIVHEVENIDGRIDEAQKSITWDAIGKRDAFPRRLCKTRVPFTTRADTTSTSSRLFAPKRYPFGVQVGAATTTTTSTRRRRRGKPSAPSTG